MDISRKSIAVMIDELITTNIKCFMEQEKLMNFSLNSVERLDAAVRTQQLNIRRNQLIRALDKEIDEETVSVSEKTYDKEGK